MAELSDSQIAHVFNQAEARAKSWRMPADTLQPEVEEVLPEYFAKFEDLEEETNEAPSNLEESDQPQEQPEEIETLAQESEEAPTEAASFLEEASDDEENLSQDEIQAMIAQMQGEDSAGNSEPSDNNLDEENEPPDNVNMAMDNDPSADLQDATGEASIDENQTSFDDQEMMTADDIEALLRGSDDEDEIDSGGPDESQVQNDPEIEQAELESADLDYSPTNSLENDETDLLSQDGFDEIASEETDILDSLKASEAEPDEEEKEDSEDSEKSKDVTELIPTVSEIEAEEEPDEESNEILEEETGEEGLPELTASEADDQMMSKEELSAMLRQEEQDEQEEKIESPGEESNEQTEEIVESSVTMEEKVQGSTQFNPPSKAKSSATSEGAKDRIQALVSKAKSNLKFIIPSAIGLIAIATAALLYPTLKQPDAPEPSLAHPSEAWKWKRNPNTKSTVKYQIKAPGVLLTLSNLTGVKFPDLLKTDGAPLKEYYEGLENQREILKFRLLGEVKYFKSDTDMDPVMIHYDFFYRDLDDKNHLKRATYFKVSEIILKMEFSAASDDADLISSESETAKNLNDVFKSVFGLSELKYVPEFSIGQDLKSFENNIQYLAQRSLLLDK